MYIKLILQVITVHHTSLLVPMEGAFLILIGVMALMTVEITVMKMDVSNGRWEETRCSILYRSLVLVQKKIVHNLQSSACDGS